MDMSGGEMNHAVRLLPWTGSQGQPCLLVSDGDGPASRIADRVEAAQLGLAGRLLGRAQEVIAASEGSIGELGALAAQLVDALRDALLIAECRGARLGAMESSTLEIGEGITGDLHDVLAHSPAGPQVLAALSLPGTDRTSARVARRWVRSMAQLQKLPSGAVDDLETITGELVANALEHSSSHTITVTLTLASKTATVSVRDEGRRRRQMAQASAGPGQVEERGRGLQITDVLAARWGRQRSGKGLTVWAEVATDTSIRTG